MFTMTKTTFRLMITEMTTTNSEDRNNLDDNDNNNNHLDLEPRIGENFLFKTLGKPEVCVCIFLSLVFLFLE